MIRALSIAVSCLAVAALAADSATRSGKEIEALVSGQLPDDPARALVQGKCLLCHSGDYVTQQRLTEAQWQRTVDKMRKFGTPASDEEAKQIVAYLSRYWTPDLPPPRVVRAPAPAGNVSRK
jgi:Spy/CpxP family protein refolding chaperone